MRRVYRASPRIETVSLAIGAPKRLTADSLTPHLRGRITGVDVLAKWGVSWAVPSGP